MGQILYFLRRRFARLGPLHYATLAVYVAIGIGSPMIGLSLNEPQKYDMRCFIPNILFLQSFGICHSISFNGPSWSISAEMACYFLFPAFVIIYRIHFRLFGAIALFLLAILYGAGWVNPDYRAWAGWTYDFGVLRAIPAFVFGMVLYGFRGRLSSIPFPAFLMFAAIVIAFVLAEFGVSEYALFPVMYLIAALAVAADGRGKISRAIRILAPFGQLTYSAYMIHALFPTIVFTLIFDRILHASPFWKNLGIISSLPLLLIAAYISLFTFEMPARKWLTGARRAGDRVAGPPASASISR